MTAGDACTDLALTCADCGAPFTFTAGEQQFFSAKGFAPPKRCKACLQARRQHREARQAQMSAAEPVS